MQERVYLFEVVRTVNHVYAVIVKTVMAAKSHPNLYVYVYQQPGKRGQTQGSFGAQRTSIPQTNETSSAVGTIRNKTDCRTNVMPLGQGQQYDLEKEEAPHTWFLDRWLWSAHPSVWTGGI